MPRLRVRDVMTREVITARDDTSYAQIAAILVGQRISAVPIVDRFDVVVGVVSWTDLYDKIKVGDPDAANRAGRWRRWTAPLLRWPAGSAVEVMSAPPLTVRADVSLAAVARMMYRRNVGRLLVVDDSGRLQGLVSRSDLLKVHRRMDAVIRDDVLRVLRETLMIGPDTAQATVVEGVVTLTGRTARKTIALAAARLTQTVAGVTDVIDRLTFDLDDTVMAVAPSGPADHDPFRGLWISHRIARSTPGIAGSTPRIARSTPRAGDRRSGQDTQRATTTEVLQ